MPGGRLAPRGSSFFYFHIMSAGSLGDCIKKESAGAVNEEERGLACCLARLSVQPPNDMRELINSFAFFLGVLIVDSFLEAVEDQAIDTLNLAIGTRMGNRHILDVDAGILAKFPEGLGSEV